MKKKIYIKPASYLLPAPLLLGATPLSLQHIGNDPVIPIGGEGDPDDEGDAPPRLWDEELENKIPNTLW
jgi:hypothetical protein